MEYGNLSLPERPNHAQDGVIDEEGKTEDEDDRGRVVFRIAI
jgi:hypothetical protein